MLYGVVFSPHPQNIDQSIQGRNMKSNWTPATWISNLSDPYKNHKKKTSKNHKTGYLPWFTTKKMGLSNTLSILSHLYPMRHVSAMAPRPWASKKTTSGISSESSWISGFSRAQGKHNSWARPRNLWNQWFLCGSIYMGAHHKCLNTWWARYIDVNQCFFFLGIRCFNQWIR